jgi:hypothetical protein
LDLCSGVDLLRTCCLVTGVHQRIVVNVRTGLRALFVLWKCSHAQRCLLAVRARWLIGSLLVLYLQFVMAGLLASYFVGRDVAKAV